MTNTCSFAATTKVSPLNQISHIAKKILSFNDVNCETEVITLVFSRLSNMHNSLQCLHNSNWDEEITLSELTITACEEYNMTKAQNLFRLDEIAELKEDWNGYGAKSFSPKLIDIFKRIINDLEFQPKIFPTGRQSVQFQYELKNRSYLEFEIFGEKVSCLEVPKRIYSNANTFEFPISKAQMIKEIVKKFYEQYNITE